MPHMSAWHSNNENMQMRWENPSRDHVCLTPASWELWSQSRRILQKYYMDFTEVCVACVVMKSWREEHLLEVGGMLIN